MIRKKVPDTTNLEILISTTSKMAATPTDSIGNNGMPAAGNNKVVLAGWIWMTWGVLLAADSLTSSGRYLEKWAGTLTRFAVDHPGQLLLRLYSSRFRSAF